MLPVGLGTLDDGAFGNVGEPTEARVRAERLDESLAILEGLWTGEPFAFEGKHYRFGPMTFRPTPIQRPRIPIWVVAVHGSERSMARALRYDGILAEVEDPAGVAELADDAARAAAARRPAVRDRRPGPDAARPPTRATEIVSPFAAAGATWWIDADWDGSTVETVRRRIAAGPPTPKAGADVSGGSSRRLSGTSETGSTASGRPSSVTRPSLGSISIGAVDRFACRSARVRPRVRPISTTSRPAPARRRSPPAAPRRRERDAQAARRVRHPAPVGPVARRFGPLDRRVAFAERRPGDHPGLQHELRLDPEPGRRPQHDVGEPPGRERPDPVRDAVDDRGLDRDLREVAQDALGVVARVVGHAGRPGSPAAASVARHRFIVSAS